MAYNPTTGVITDPDSIYDVQQALGESGGGGSQSPKVEKQDKSLLWVGGFLLGLVILAVVLAII